jgi:hypothetical protein
MNPQLLPAQLDDGVPAWTQTVQAFLAEKERRSGSRRTVEGYARMLWPFLSSVGSPDRVTPAHVLAWAHGIGVSGREPSSATVGARIACLSSYFRFLIRMSIATANPCDALERPRTVPSLARGLTADQIRGCGRPGSWRPPGPVEPRPPLWHAGTAWSSSSTDRRITGNPESPFGGRRSQPSPPDEKDTN